MDPFCPATSPDGNVPVPTGNAPSNPAIVTASDASVWVATFQAFKHLGYFVNQILPGLSLKARPTSLSHKKAATVTFTVADAGQPVSGAKVSCLGKKGQTAASGQVRLHFAKGTAAGKHVCTAAKSGYNAGKTTLKVT